MQRLARLAPDTLAELRYTGNLLRRALSVLAAAAYWDRPCCGFTDPFWTLIGLYPRGRLLAPPGADTTAAPRCMIHVGAVVVVPATNHHRADHPGNEQITTSRRRPSRGFRSASRVTASSSFSAPDNRAPPQGQATRTSRPW